MELYSLIIGLIIILLLVYCYYKPKIYWNDYIVLFYNKHNKDNTISRTGIILW